MLNLRDFCHEFRQGCDLLEYEGDGYPCLYNSKPYVITKVKTKPGKWIDGVRQRSVIVQLKAIKPDGKLAKLEKIQYPFPKSDGRQLPFFLTALKHSKVKYERVVLYKAK